jgi:hypothetical protein
MQGYAPHVLHLASNSCALCISSVKTPLKLPVRSRQRSKYDVNLATAWPYYRRMVKYTAFTVVETEMFERYASDSWSEEER